MMYRCGWVTKPGQERVLAVEITRSGFDGGRPRTGPPGSAASPATPTATTVVRATAPQRPPPLSPSRQSISARSRPARPSMFDPGPDFGVAAVTPAPVRNSWWLVADSDLPATAGGHRPRGRAAHPGCLGGVTAVRLHRGSDHAGRGRCRPGRHRIRIAAQVKYTDRPIGRPAIQHWLARRGRGPQRSFSAAGYSIQAVEFDTAPNPAGAADAFASRTSGAVLGPFLPLTATATRLATLPLGRLAWLPITAAPQLTLFQPVLLIRATATAASRSGSDRQTLRWPTWLKSMGTKRGACRCSERC
jgi:hypothetical protein